MAIWLVCILKLIFISLVSGSESETGSGSIPKVMCGYAADSQKEKVFQFSIPDVPARCDAIQLGVYFFDVPDYLPSATETLQQIASVVEDGQKNLWMVVAFEGVDKFDTIVDLTSDYDTYITPMLDIVQKNGINGIILDYPTIFNASVADFGCKMSAFVCKMKECVPTLKVALCLPGWVYDSFSNTEIIDFSQTNDVLDMYIVNVINAGYGCDKDALVTGLLPIKNIKKEFTTLDLICDAVKNSAIDQSKLSIMFMIGVPLEIGNTTTYSTYCKKCTTSNLDTTDTYCPDTIQRFYDAAKYASGYFKGMVFVSLDRDDFDNSCCCDPFPIANAYIDGFENAEIKCCANLS